MRDAGSRERRAKQGSASCLAGSGRNNRRGLRRISSMKYTHCHNSRGIQRIYRSSPINLTSKQFLSVKSRPCWMLALAEFLERCPSLVYLSLQCIEFVRTLWLEQVIKSALHFQEIFNRRSMWVDTELVLAFLNFVEWEVLGLNRKSCHFDRLVSRKAPTYRAR